MRPDKKSEREGSNPRLLDKSEDPARLLGIAPQYSLHTACLREAELMLNELFSIFLPGNCAIDY